MASYLISSLITYCSRTFTYLTGKDETRPRFTGGFEDCRFPIGNDTSHTFALPDGRKLGYAEYGSPTGRVVFFLHGTPSSRIEAASFHHIAVRLGARIISVDRPGYGWSEIQKERKVADYAGDIEALAEGLRVEEYAVLGISGGGPYALACAAGLPVNKLKAVSVVVGMGLPDMNKKGMHFLNRGGWTIGYLYLPSLVRWWFSREPASRLELSREERLSLIQQQFSPSKVPEQDYHAFTSEDGDFLRLYVHSAEQAFAQGFEGMLMDGKVMCQDPGFGVEDIREDLPLQLWYGRFDGNCPHGFGEQTAARFKGKAMLRVLDETHISLGMFYREEYLRALVGAW